MKRLICLFCVTVILFTLSSCGRRAMDASYGDDGKMLFLVAGLDEAAENTDVLFTLGIDTNENRSYIAQIPRDTYFNFGKSQNKINQIYSSQRACGVAEDSAMNTLVNCLGEALGCDFDGYLALKISAVGDIVDIIGGIDIELKSDMQIKLDGEEPISLKAGKNHINGTVAQSFVRYREGYASADLGRIDAQKLFLNSLFAKMSSGMSLPALFSLAKHFEKNSYTNVRLTEFVPIIFKACFSTKSPLAYFVTMPGEADVTESGLSYYFLNKTASGRVAQKYMFAKNEFDSKKIFVNTSQKSFINIYNDENLVYNEYSGDDVHEISLDKR